MKQKKFYFGTPNFISLESPRISLGSNPTFCDTMSQELRDVLNQGNVGNSFEVYEVTFKKIKAVRIIKKIEEVKDTE